MLSQTPPQFRTRWFFVSSGTSYFGSALTSLALLSLAVKQEDALGAMWIAASGYVAVMIGGVSMGVFARHLPLNSIPRLTEGVRACILLLVFSKERIPFFWVLVLNVLILALEGVYHSTRYHLIRHWLPGEAARSRFIATLQSVDGTSSIIAPLLAGMCLQFVNVRWCLLIDAVTYMMSFCYWHFGTTTSPETFEKNEALSLWGGYRAIVRNSGLLKLNVGRILGNTAFVFLNLSMPVLLLREYGEKSWTGAQGAALGSMAAAILLTNYLIQRSVTQTGSANILERRYLKVAGYPLLLGITTLCLIKYSAIPVFWIFPAAFLFGIANACLRTGGILIGQRITHASILHLVIASGDSIVRLISAMMALTVAAVLGAGDLLFLAVAAIVAFLATLSIKFYHAAGNEELA